MVNYSPKQKKKKIHLFCKSGSSLVLKWFNQPSEECGMQYQHPSPRQKAPPIK